MKLIAINGSPRKDWNTATLLKKALEGAASEGAETELIHLYDYDFKGCMSCFSCKTKGGKSYGKCGMKDELTPILEKVGSADALILGSPIYFWACTGEMKSFMERLLFPYFTYTNPRQSLFGREMNTGFIYTMGASEERMKELGGRFIGINESFLKMIFGACESILCFETYQFEDYSKVEFSLFDVEQRKRRREEVFPKDCEKALEMGVRFAARKNEGG